jgi:uncharacterized protein (DUF302 family)
MRRLMLVVTAAGLLAVGTNSRLEGPALSAMDLTYGGSQQPDAGIITKASRFPVSETVERLQNAIKTKGLTLFAHVDHSGEAAKAGLTMQDAHLLIFGNPRAGTPIMVASPLAALDLPLKVLIWKDRDGSVKVSYNSTTYLATRHGITPELSRNIAGIDALVDGALKD